MEANKSVSFLDCNVTFLLKDGYIGRNNIHMKNLSLYVFSFLMMIQVISCKKLDDLTKFDMEYKETVVIPNNNGFIDLPFNLETEDTETNAESEFAENDTRKDLIEEIILKSMTLTLLSPNNADFSFLESIRVFINANELGEKEIAWKLDITDDGSTILILDVTNTDLNDYIQKDKFKLRINTVTDEVLNEDHSIEVATVFSVDAKIAGI